MSSRSIEPGKFAHRLTKLGQTMGFTAKAMAAATATDLAHPNTIRVWEEMQAGAVFTEPNIHYQRGAWRLAPDEALVIEGHAPSCLYWNVMLYSRFLNSLDHRHRPVSLTGARAVLEGDRFRLVLSASDRSSPRR